LRSHHARLTPGIPKNENSLRARQPRPYSYFQTRYEQATDRPPGLRPSRKSATLHGAHGFLRLVLPEGIRVSDKIIVELKETTKIQISGFSLLILGFQSSPARVLETISHEILRKEWYNSSQKLPVWRGEKDDGQVDKPSNGIGLDALPLCPAVVGGS
jgi:hypothetical protein